VKRVVAYTLMLIVASALSSSVSAKGPAAVEVCGADACTTVRDAAMTHQMAWIGGSGVRSPAPSAYYTVRFVPEEGPRESHPRYYVPSAGAMRRLDERRRAQWEPVNQTARDAYARATAGLEPFPRPELTAARVGSRVVRGEASSYLRLYTVGMQFRGPMKRSKWLPIVLESAEPSPWTDGASRLAYAPAQRLLRRDGGVFKLSRTLARALARAAALNWQARPPIFCPAGTPSPWRRAICASRRMLRGRP
jgi:hypothetical protein